MAYRYSHFILGGKITSVVYFTLLKEVITFNPTSPLDIWIKFSHFCLFCQKDHNIVTASKRICA